MNQIFGSLTGFFDVRKPCGNVGARINEDNLVGLTPKKTLHRGFSLVADRISSAFPSFSYLQRQRRVRVSSLLAHRSPPRLDRGHTLQAF